MAGRKHFCHYNNTYTPPYHTKFAIISTCMLSWGLLEMMDSAHWKTKMANFQYNQKPSNFWISQVFFGNFYSSREVTQLTTSWKGVKGNNHNLTTPYLVLYLILGDLGMGFSFLGMFCSVMKQNWDKTNFNPTWGDDTGLKFKAGKPINKIFTHWYLIISNYVYNTSPMHPTCIWSLLSKLPPLCGCKHLSQFLLISLVQTA